MTKKEKINTILKNVKKIGMSHPTGQLFTNGYSSILSMWKIHKSN